MSAAGTSVAAGERLKAEDQQPLYDIKVRYVDERDRSLIDEDVIEAQPEGETVTAGAIEFFGYELSGDHDPVISFKVTNNPAANVIIFYYAKKPDFTVQVHYLDENGKPVDETRSKTYSVPPGTTVTEEAVYFDRYVPVEPTVHNMTVTAPATITFPYRHLGTNRYNVTVKYIDGGGTKLHDNFYIYDKAAGEPVSASAIDIPGYVLNDAGIKEWTVNVPAHEGTPSVENIITFAYKAVGLNPPALNKPDHFAYVAGYPDGEVKPLGTITREEVAAIFYRLMTEESRRQYYSASAPFADVAAGRWSNDAIATLYNAKILRGNTDGSFEPSKPITRAEFAAITSRFDELEGVGKSWIGTYGDGTFRPDNTIIRCEAMKMINEALDRRVDAEGLIQGTKQWPDNTSDKWYFEIVLEATNTHDYQREDRPKSTEKWTKIKDSPVW